MGEILTQEQLRHVSEHVYSVEDWNSLLDPYMRVFWTKLQKVTPKALNGNVITVFGLSFNIISLVILMSYAPTATEKVRTVGQNHLQLISLHRRSNTRKRSN